MCQIYSFFTYGIDSSNDRDNLFTVKKTITCSTKMCIRDRITAALIEHNIGISKDFNNFELLNAFITKNIYKVNQIIAYFEKNPKSNPLIVTISVLFNFYANLMLLYFIQDKSESNIMAELKLRNIFQARDYLTAMQNYNAYKCMDIISYIREYDARSKGVENASGTTEASLLKELAYKILH